MDANDIDRILHKVNQLDANDPVRRGLLEKIGDWWDAHTAVQREKIEKEIEKRVRRLAY